MFIRVSYRFLCTVIIGGCPEFLLLSDKVQSNLFMAFSFVYRTQALIRDAQRRRDAGPCYVLASFISPNGDSFEEK